VEAPFALGAGPVCPNELLGEPNECPGEKLEAPPPPRAPGPFASAVKDTTASIMAMAASEKIFFMDLSLGLDRPRWFTGPKGPDDRGNGLSALGHLWIQNGTGGGEGG
jgi:hypothetical protein